MTFAVTWQTFQDEVGLAYGYTTLVHRLREACLRAGVINDPDAATAVFIESPLRFEPLLGRRNILFSMWESDDFPEETRRNLRAVDHLIVPTDWNVGMFRPYVRPECPITVCPLGIDPDLFRPAKRLWKPDTSFQWLWVGAPTVRKGFDVIQECWNTFGWARRTDAHLHIKTTGMTKMASMMAQQMGFQATKEANLWVLPQARWVLDARDLPVEVLAQLYQTSHGFLLPTGGEGWALTLHEAMATGCPAITTDYGGQLHYAKDYVTRLPWRPHEVTAVMAGKRTSLKVRLMTAMADVLELHQAMVLMMRDYRKALLRARDGARHVRQYTWERTGRQFVAVLRSEAGRAPSLAA